MKTPSPALAVLLASIVCLSACGDDKSANDKSAQSTQAQTDKSAEPAPTANESVSASQNEPSASPAQANTEAPNKAQTKTQETKTQEAPTTVNPANTESPKTEVKALSLEEGKKRYEATCKICHDQGLLDAPKLTAKADWAKRLDKGMDTLYVRSAKGFGKMPAQAVGDVSEAEVYAAVDYMVSQVK